MIIPCCPSGHRPVPVSRLDDRIHWKSCKGKRFLFTFATNKPNMSLNDWIKEQEQRGITTFSFQQIRCVTE